MPEEGGVSFVSQSGALAVAIADIAKKENIKFSQLVSVGNKMQLNESNFIEYAGQDENTKMIAMYLEGVENGREFVRIAKKVSKKKPIVILKAGKSEKAQKAIQSHTGSLAGSDKIMNAAFEKAGVIRAESLDEFFALIKIISNFDVSTNNQSAIITNAGGPGVLATDNFQDKFISLANLSNETREKLEDFLPAEASTGNPIDLLGDADELRYKKALEALQNEKIGNII
jgi:acetyltransferase